jgi:superfamily II DNA or RNA helicase
LIAIPANSFDLRITPQGLLRDDSAVSQSGNGLFLLSLVKDKIHDAALGKRYFRSLFSNYLHKLAALGEASDADLSAFYQQARPNESETAFQALSLPPITGAEYFDAELLRRFYREFEAALQEKFSASQLLFSDFMRSLSPAWKDVGKVAFHLAENKGDSSGSLPFAFMASFIHRAEGDKPKHLPLAAALKAYAGQPQALETLLAPIQNAAGKSELIQQLLESRRIFQPAAWSSQEAFAFLQDIPLFEEANIVVRIVNLWKSNPTRAKVSVTLDVDKKGLFGAAALLNFSIGVSLGGETLTPAEIEELLHSQGGLVRIKGQWIAAEPEKIAALLEQWQEAERLARLEGLSLAAGLRLLAGAELQAGKNQLPMDQDCCSFEASGELKNLLQDLRNPAEIPIPELPSGLGRVLRPYQRDGVKYLWRTSSLGLGTCLADDMGLGKTLQVLALIKLWKQSGNLRKLPVLLVLPATLLANWKNESARFTPDLKLVTLHASAMEKKEWSDFEEDAEAYLSQFDLALVTYGMLPRLPKLAELNFPAVIADEAQAIKNPASKQSRAVRGLQARQRIALTGTPVENRLADLWSIFDFVNPGLLGNLKHFLDFSKNLANDYTPLRKLTQPFILRRLKTDKRIINDLPDKTEVKVYCALSKRQAALYQNCVEDMQRAIQQETEGIRRRGIVLGFLMRFKQICNHPAHFLGNGDYKAEDAGKFLRLGELVESIASRQEKLLIFTQFRELTQALHDYLQSCFDRPGLILHGGTPVKERAELVRTFQEDDSIPFFVLSLKAAGTGLNLTAANHVIHFDRWWNPAVENQASDRAFRIGQKRNVLVHKFICKGTLEEKIDALIMEKQSLAEELLGAGAEKLLTQMSNAELLNFVQLDSKQLE